MKICLSLFLRDRSWGSSSTVTSLFWRVALCIYVTVWSGWLIAECCSVLCRPGGQSEQQHPGVLRGGQAEDQLLQQPRHGQHLQSRHPSPHVTLSPDKYLLLFRDVVQQLVLQSQNYLISAPASPPLFLLFWLRLQLQLRQKPYFDTYKIGDFFGLTT